MSGDNALGKHEGADTKVHEGNTVTLALGKVAGKKREVHSEDGEDSHEHHVRAVRGESG